MTAERFVIPATLAAVNLAFRGKSNVATIAEHTGLEAAEVLDVLAGAGFTPDAFGIPRQQTSPADRRPNMPLPTDHPDKKIAALAKKVQADSARLADMVRAYDAAAQARHDVARLEAELAAAKARLRGGGKPTAVPAVDVPAPEVRRWANENGVPVPKAGMVPRRVVEAYLAATA